MRKSFPPGLELATYDRYHLVVESEAEARDYLDRVVPGVLVASCPIPEPGEPCRWGEPRAVWVEELNHLRTRASAERAAAKLAARDAAEARLVERVGELLEGLPGRVAHEVWVARMDEGKPCIQITLDVKAFDALADRLPIPAE